MGKLKTTEEFINEAIKTHGDIYDYSLVIYTGALIKVKIICKKHGIFEQNPCDHIRGNKCYMCNKDSRYNQLTTEDFIVRAKLKHGDRYDYSLVKYKNMGTNVKIICKKHGMFEQIAYHHLNNSNCPACSNLKKKTTKEFINIAMKVHNNKFDYSLVNYINNRTKVKIICPIHGMFEQNPKHHLNGVGCKLCNLSKGEKQVSKILNEHNIQYKKEKTFKGCKSKKLLQFDFYLPKYNILIEYDGIQHYKPVGFFGGKKEFKETQMRDNIKNKYCKDNNINLIRIRYDENIEERLSFLLDSK